MAKLPGDTVASITPILPQADRPTVSYKGGIAQAAGVELGEGIGQLGTVGLDAAMKIQDTQDRLSRAAAEQDFISRKLDIDQQFADDQNYQTAPQRYGAALNQALVQSAASLRGDVQRADFQSAMAPIIQSSVGAMQQNAVAAWRNQGRANTVAALDSAVDNALRAPDSASENALFSSVRDRLSAARDSGWISEDERQNWSRATAQGYALKRATMLADANPVAAVQALQPSGVAADGTPTFDPTGDWRDYLDPAKRMAVVQAAQAHAQANARADQVEATRQLIARDKAEKDIANGIANSVVTQLVADPTKVDPKAIANDPRFPASQWPIKNALIDMTHAALQQNAGTDAKTYGPGFWQAFQAVHAPDGDPTKITDPAQLYLRAGPDGDLTAAGVDRLTAEMQAKATPEGEAESAMKKAFLENARAQITGTNEGLHISDPAGDALYLKFLAQALPAFDAGKQAGKSAVQLLNPDSPDYIGKSIALFQRPPALLQNEPLGTAGDLQSALSAGMPLAPSESPVVPGQATGPALSTDEQKAQSTPATTPAESNSPERAGESGNPFPGLGEETPTDVDTLRLPNGDSVINPLTNQPLIMPAGVSVQANIAAGKAIRNKYLEMINSIDPTAEMDMSHLVNAEAERGRAMRLLFNRHGGPMDYQRTNGYFDRSLAAFSSYNFGAVARAAGYSRNEALLGAGIYNLRSTGDKSGKYFNNIDNVPLIKLGWDQEPHFAPGPDGN